MKIKGTQNSKFVPTKIFMLHSKILGAIGDSFLISRQKWVQLLLRKILKVCSDILNMNLGPRSLIMIYHLDFRNSFGATIQRQILRKYFSKTSVMISKIYENLREFFS